MANIKSAIKNNRKSIARELRNRSRKSRLKTLAKKISDLAAGEDKAALKSAVATYISALDKAIKSNLVHPNKASRAKSRMSKHLAA